jgi:O-antigen ligase
MFTGGTSTRAPLVVAGTSAVALLLGATRWGSYIGVNPLFLTDVLLLFGLAQWALIRLNSRQAPRNELAARSHPGILFGLFFTYILARVAFASTQDVPPADWIRDSAPFVYAFLAFVSASAFASSSQETRKRTAKVLTVALAFHLLWTTVSIWSHFGGIPLPGGAAAVFQLRPDIDMAMLGVGAGVFLLAGFRAKKRLWPIVAVVVSLLDVFALQSRAGLISVVASLFIAYLIFYFSTAARSGRRLFSQMLIPIAIAAALIVLPQTGPGQRLVATINSSSAVTQAQLSAQGTENARRLVWSQVIEWTNEKPARQLFGSGFGNDFLTQSGTLSFLEGTTYDNVRSPHNWFIGIYARMGTVGLLLAIATIAAVLLGVLRGIRRAARDNLLAIASMITVAVLPIATLGVVLEAPFGAVPFWWAAGIVLASSSASSWRTDDHARASVARPPRSEDTAVENAPRHDFKGPSDSASVFEA